MNASLSFVRLVSFVILLQSVAAFSATSAKPKRITWKGVETFESAYTYNGRNSGVLGHANLYRARVTINFTYIEETDAQGNSRFTSKTISWTAGGIAVANGFEKTECRGKGQANVLGRENQRINLDCRQTKYSVYWGFFPQPPGSITPPKIVTWAELRNDCSYSEEQPWDHGFHRYSVSVAADVDAVMEVSTQRNSDYWQFVPEVGKKISFSVRSNVPARFRFTLENVSHFPGFATNANIDEDFFAKYGLNHDQYLDEGQYLRDHYKNEDADLIFDPQDFVGSKKYWKRPAPDMQVMETAQDASGASVTVTAMDFGAYGHLRAEVKTKCGGWQPVRIRVGGQDRSFVTIPMDENNNFIADRMEQPNNGITRWAYTGDPSSDEDQEPRGDGTPGDGLTTFEEYRGFVIASDPDCWKHDYIRTDPRTKDIFISTDDPQIASLIDQFGDRSGIVPHHVCPGYYVEDSGLISSSCGVGSSSRHTGYVTISRRFIINFTLQVIGRKQWNGKAISQNFPQHGVSIIDHRLPGGLDGMTFTDTCSPGSPKHVEVVAIDERKCLAAGEHFNVDDLQLTRVVIHELGHSVAVRHHGDGNIEGPIVLLNDVQSCPEKAIQGSVNGKVACKYHFIAMRNQQNSGEQSCPMKYTWWSWYVPIGATLTKLDSPVEFKYGFLHLKSQTLPGYVLTPASSSLRSYNKAIDTKYLEENIGKFCVSQKGTGINSGSENHAGDAERGNCAAQVHVNDTR